MAIYKDGKHNSNNVIVKSKNKVYLERAKKAKKNKEKLIKDLISDMMDDNYGYRDFIEGLCYEALQKRSQKELKEILYGTN